MHNDQHKCFCCNRPLPKSGNCLVVAANGAQVVVDAECYRVIFQTRSKGHQPQQQSRPRLYAAGWQPKRS